MNIKILQNIQIEVDDWGIFSASAITFGIGKLIGVSVAG
jgi:hypothetical protein